MFSQSKFPWVSVVNWVVLFNSLSLSRLLFLYLTSTQSPSLSFFSFISIRSSNQCTKRSLIICVRTSSWHLCILTEEKEWERIRGGTENKKGGRGTTKPKSDWCVSAWCCSPFKCNEQSDALQCYVSYVKTEWMETEWKLFLFSMWMKNTFSVL